MAQLQQPKQFTRQWQDAVARFVDDFGDVLDAKIIECYRNLTDWQVEQRLIKKQTTKNRKSWTDRWEKILAEADIDIWEDLEDDARRANFYDIVEAGIKHGDFGSTTGAITRTIDHFGTIMTSLHYPNHRIVKLGLDSVLSDLHLTEEDVQPYDVGALAKLLTEVLAWIDDPKKAPSLNDRASAGKRRRAPSAGTIERLLASIVLCMNSACRIGDMEEMPVDAINMETGRIEWARFKNQRVGRRMSGELRPWQVEMIRPWVEFRTAKHPDATHFLVSPRKGTAIKDQERLTQPLRRAMLALGIIEEGERAGFHRFRHTVAVAALRKGKTFSQVAYALGSHESTIAKVYAKFANDEVGIETRGHLADEMEDALDFLAGKTAEPVEPVEQPLTWEQTALKVGLWQEANQFAGDGMTAAEPSFTVVREMPQPRPEDTFEGTDEDRRDLTPGSAYSKHMLEAMKGHKGADCGARTHDLGIYEVISANAQEALVALASGDSSKAAAILAHLAQWGGQ